MLIGCIDVELEAEHTFLRLQLEVGTSDHHAVEASNTFAAAACVVVVAGGDVAAVADADEPLEEEYTAQELNRVVCVTS